MTSPQELYEFQRRPGDPPWWKLPNYDDDAMKEFNCFGKEHWNALAAGRRPRN